MEFRDLIKKALDKDVPNKDTFTKEEVIDICEQIFLGFSDGIIKAERKKG